MAAETPTRTVYVGLGSNLGDSAGTVRAAFDALRPLGDHFQNSDLYLTRPWGVDGQADYINAVAAFDTQADPRSILASLRTIEERFGRPRRDGRRFEPRTLDLDLLMAGDLVIDEPGLTLPHPQMRERAFVLEPLAEIACDTGVPPDGSRVGALLEELPAIERAGVLRLARTATLVAPPRVDYDAPGGAGERYHDLRPFTRFDETVLAAVIDALSPLAGKRVLDVGCGTGRFTRRLAAAGATVIGFDASETMLATARASAAPQTCEYVRGDANVALPAGPFHAITAFYCIQYIDAGAFARRAIEVLTPGGTLAIATFPHRHFAETEFARYFPSLPAIDMARFPSVPALCAALSAAGFERPETRELPMRIEDDPEALLARVRGKYLSSFFLLPPGEFERGVERMAHDWKGRKSVVRIAQGVVIAARTRQAAR